MTTTQIEPASTSTTTTLSAAAADAPAMARSLAAAFHDDPIFTWLDPDPSSRRRHLPAWFAVATAAVVRHGESSSVDAGAGAALWVPPSTEPMTEAEGERLGEVTEPMGPAVIERIAALGEVMDAAHPEEPHHYLWLLGVTPQQQGRGLGSRLLAATLDRLDQVGEPAYLEATSSANRRLYVRHGFEVTGVIAAPGAPPLWPMWRAPGTASSETTAAGAGSREG